MGILDAILGTGNSGLLGGERPASYQAPSNRPSFAERLTDLLSSDRFQGSMAGLASGDTWQDSLARSSIGYAAGKKSDKATADEKARRAQLNAWLKAKSADMAPEDAALLMDNPKLAENWAADVLKPQKYEAPATTADITNYQFAKQNGYAGTFQDFRNEGQAGRGTKYGNSPIYGQDANGNTVILQPGDNGTLVQPKIPEGIKINPGIRYNDLGTAIQGTDRFGNPVTTMQKDVAGAAQQQAVGKAQGDAAAMLPSARQQAALVDKQITDLKMDPALPSVLGTIDSRTPAIFPDARRAQARIDQIKSQTFLQGYQMLKGGGAITEVEGMKAEQAMARLDQAQDEADFKAALDDFNNAVKEGVAKLEAAAGPAGPRQLPGGVTIEQIQ